MNEKVIINEFAEKIVKKGLSVPAIFLLETLTYKASSLRRVP